MEKPIDLTGTDDQIASWVWHNLVPPSGQAGTVQGELLRAVEKLRWEAQENGNINWDDGFLILISFLEQHLLNSPVFSPADRAALQGDLGRLRDFLPVDELISDEDTGSLPYVGDDLYDRLTSCVVAFVRANPHPLPYPANPRLRR